MNCVYCRGKIERGATSCPHCGAPVTSDEGGRFETNDISDMLKKAVDKVIGDKEARQSGLKNRYIAAILGIFLGTFGIHNFYLGRIPRAVFQLILGVTGVLTAVSAIWGFVEGLLCLFGNYKDGKGRPLA